MFLGLVAKSAFMHRCAKRIKMQQGRGAAYQRPPTLHTPSTPPRAPICMSLVWGKRGSGDGAHARCLVPLGATVGPRGTVDCSTAADHAASRAPITARANHPVTSYANFVRAYSSACLTFDTAVAPAAAVHGQ